jgi:RNA polymerase sigma-70 factor (ECF subfamily)
MENECSNEQARDAQSVSAVRAGDMERYREPVERHERRVFAVAWSRLGDAALAEEAAQEAFIRGYRNLWLLGDGAKFAGWITSIARRAAINFGLRHRRELDKRERWALEKSESSAPAAPADETYALPTPETLRQTLAELPAAHRECLVLFNLEGKSGTEAAAALGISEAALRVRLHRARGAMRERLEEKLEGSLAGLRFESLRILGALDRVKDLDNWQFRPQRRGVAQGQLCWNDIEAWVCQQRLEKILKARKDNPAAPVHSLLEP